MPTESVHVYRHYPAGIGHIEQRGAEWLVSFVGMRITQAYAPTLQAARYALRRLAAAEPASVGGMFLAA